MLKTSATLGALVALMLLGPAHAQDAPSPDVPGAEGLSHAPNGVFHGNYCGVGDNGPGLPPTDALDNACMHHDACTPGGGIPSCECNATFRRETHAVAVSPDASDDLKTLAGVVEAAIPVIPCH